MYKIKLNQFEGPLDLLLFFIRRDEIDIYDIPIYKLTRDFFEYLNIMQQLDLEIAGEFILMATSLMQIKVKMLLPKEIDEKGEEIDPRNDLVKALLEYKRYKEMSDELVFLETHQSKVFYRGYTKNDETEKPDEYGTLLKNITLFDLIKAFKDVLARKKDEPVHQIKKIPVSIDEQMNFILNSLKEKGTMKFSELMSKMNEKIRIIVTFVAMLELIKMGRIGLRETGTFNNFEIFGLANG